MGPFHLRARRVFHPLRPESLEPGTAGDPPASFRRRLRAQMATGNSLLPRIVVTVDMIPPAPM